MDDLQKFSFEVIKELEQKFKNACCNKTAEAYLDCALLLKHKLKQFQKKQMKNMATNEKM